MPQLFALLFSAIWWNVKHNQQGIQSIVGLLFIVAGNTAFCASLTKPD